MWCTNHTPAQKIRHFFRKDFSFYVKKSVFIDLNKNDDDNVTICGSAALRCSTHD
jgi:hypothetical protein